MNKLLIAIFIAILTFLTGCESDGTNFQQGYNKGYANGYSQGKVEGHQIGYSEGQKEGYNKGYNDSSEARNKDISITDAKFHIFNEVSFKVFTIIFYILLIGLLITATAISFNNSQHHPNAKKEILGKIIFLVTGFGISYLIFRIFNLANLIIFNIDDALILTGINIFILIGSFLLSKWIGKSLEDEENVKDVIVILFSSFLLFHLFIFLTNIEIFLLNNVFFATCIISFSLGGLIYAAYKLVFKP